MVKKTTKVSMLAIFGSYFEEVMALYVINLTLMLNI